MSQSPAPASNTSRTMPFSLLGNPSSPFSTPSSTVLLSLYRDVFASVSSAFAQMSALIGPITVMEGSGAKKASDSESTSKDGTDGPHVVDQLRSTLSAVNVVLVSVAKQLARIRESDPPPTQNKNNSNSINMSQSLPLHVPATRPTSVTGITLNSPTHFSLSSLSQAASAPANANASASASSSSVSVSLPPSRPASQSQSRSHSPEDSPLMSDSDLSESGAPGLSAPSSPRKRNRSRNPSLLLSGSSRKPFKELVCRVPKQFTMSKKDIAEASSSGQMTMEALDQLVTIRIRVMGQPQRAQMLFIASDICLLIHRQKDLVRNFSSSEKARVRMSTRRPDQSDFTIIVSVLTVEGVKRLLASSRSAIAQQAWNWLDQQISAIVEGRDIPTNPVCVITPNRLMQQNIGEFTDNANGPTQIGTPSHSNSSLEYSQQPSPSPPPPPAPSQLQPSGSGGLPHHLMPNLAHSPPLPHSLPMPFPSAAAIHHAHAHAHAINSNPGGFFSSLFPQSLFAPNSLAVMQQIQALMQQQQQQPR